MVNDRERDVNVVEHSLDTCQVIKIGTLILIYNTSTYSSVRRNAAFVITGFAIVCLPALRTISAAARVDNFLDLPISESGIICSSPCAINT
jgi:hypothetical protein